MHMVSEPSAFYRQHHGVIRRARKCPYFHHTGTEIRVAWDSPEPPNYLMEEDFTDDYEAGISSAVKKATIRELVKLVKEGFIDAPTEDEPVTETTLRATSPSPKSDRHKVMELFSPPRVTAVIDQHHWKIVSSSPPAYDLETGWDFFNVEDRKLFWDRYEADPGLVLMTPECRPFCAMMNVNWERMDEEEARRI